jgi:hypothetical protein
LRIVILLICLLPTACGTSLRGLLEEDSRLGWEAETVISSAEELAPGLQDELYAAEAARHAACKPVTEAVQQRIAEGEGAFMSRLRSDFAELVALLVPIPVVERCAEAQTAYRLEVASLCRRLELRDSSLSCAD